MIPIILSLLVSILPSSTLGNLTNEQVDFANYAYIRAVDAGINSVKFIQLINCESGWNKNAIGDKGKAIGLLQFWRGTYNTYSKIYNLQGKHENPYSQILLAASMIKDGGIGHWKNCGLKIGLIN